jgi:hypothetical protein
VYKIGVQSLARATGSESGYSATAVLKAFLQRYKPSSSLDIRSAFIVTILESSGDKRGFLIEYII